MKDLFDIRSQVAVYKATQSEIIIKCTSWYKGEITYDCLIPQIEGKELKMCSATYQQHEIEIIN